MTTLSEHLDLLQLVIVAVTIRLVDSGASGLLFTSSVVIMDNEPLECSAIDDVFEFGTESETESVLPLFSTELLVLISDSEGATTIVAEEKDVVVVAANDSFTNSYELALTVNVSLGSLEMSLSQVKVDPSTMSDDGAGKVVRVVNKVSD